MALFPFFSFDTLHIAICFLLIPAVYFILAPLERLALRDFFRIEKHPPPTWRQFAKVFKRKFVPLYKSPIVPKVGWSFNSGHRPGLTHV
jgi:hypothetical protein